MIEAEWKDNSTAHTDVGTGSDEVDAMDTATKGGMSVLDFRSCLEPSRLYLSELVAVLSQRLDQLAPAFEQLMTGCLPTVVTGVGTEANDKDAPLHLVNGLLVAIKSTIIALSSDLHELASAAESSDSATSGAHEEAEKWRQAVGEMVVQVMRALTIAMTIVAEPPAGMYPNLLDGAAAADGAQLGVGSTAEGGGGVNGAMGSIVKGIAVNSSNSMTNVVPNSVMGFGEDAGAAARSEDSMQQKAVVGGWQMARDAASCLAAFARAIPLPSVDDSEADPDTGSGLGAEVDGMDVGSSSGDGSNPLLGVVQVTEMGGLLLDALQRLKHTGAISAAQTGFQGLCVALLTPTEQGRLTHRDLRRLPARYDHYALHFATVLDFPAPILVSMMIRLYHVGIRRPVSQPDVTHGSVPPLCVTIQTSYSF